MLLGVCMCPWICVPGMCLCVCVSVCVPECVSLDMSLYICPWNVSLECVSVCVSVCVPGCVSLDMSLYICPWNVSLECVSGTHLSGHVSLVCARGVLFSVPSQYSQE